MSLSHHPKIVTNGLVAYFDAGSRKSYSGSGTTCSDLTKNKYSGTLTNSPSFNSSLNGYFTFNGSTSSSYILSNTYFPQITTNITIDIWVNPDSTQSYFYTNILGNHGGTFAGLVLQQQTGVTNRFFFIYGNGSTWSNAGGTGYIDLTANTWQHLVFIKSGTNIYNYKNTVLYSSATGASTINPNAGTNFMIGNGVETVAGNRSFKGSIASCKIYNRAISSTEVLQNYNATKGRFGL